MPRRKEATRRSPRPIVCLRVNGASSTTAVTSSGAVAAAMVTAPPAME